MPEPDDVDDELAETAASLGRLWHRSTGRRLDHTGVRQLPRLRLHDRDRSVDSAVRRIREDSGSCLRFTATVAGSASPSSAQSWANPQAGSWNEALAGGTTLGGASFTIQADDACTVQLQYNGSGTRSLAADNCA